MIQIKKDCREGKVLLEVNAKNLKNADLRGSKDKTFYGNGGRAIYDADTNALHKLEEELCKLYFITL